MPLFGNKSSGSQNGRISKPIVKSQQNNNQKTNTEALDDTIKTSQLHSSSMTPATPPKLVFHCQQAQGSPTGLISDFTNVQELYEKIGSCYSFPADEILFCTLNTHRIDMENLLSSQLCLEDFIFVHRKGIKKEIEVTKTEEALGLTITDNGTGYAFIKRIKKGSIVDGIPVIQIGDHIESINGNRLVGKRHVEVAKYLKDIPMGSTFIIRLIEPLRSGFLNIGSKSEFKKSCSIGSGAETLRFRTNGPARIEKAPDDITKLAVRKINNLLENFMGINDSDLSSQIWEMADGSENTMDFAEVMDNSELESFGFTDEFIIDVWGIVTDAKAGRLKHSSSTPTSTTSMDDLEHQFSKVLMSKTAK